MTILRILCDVLFFLPAGLWAGGLAVLARGIHQQALARREAGLGEPPLKQISFMRARGSNYIDTFYSTVVVSVLIII